MSSKTAKQEKEFTSEVRQLKVILEEHMEQSQTQKKEITPKVEHKVVLYTAAQPKQEWILWLKWSLTRLFVSWTLFLLIFCTIVLFWETVELCHFKFRTQWFNLLVTLYTAALLSSAVMTHSLTREWVKRNRVISFLGIKSRGVMPRGRDSP